MTDEEQALYAELEAQAGGPETTKVKLDHVEEADEPPAKTTNPPQGARPPREASTPPRRTEPEAG